MNKGQRAKLKGPSVSEQVAALEQRLAILEADYQVVLTENAQLKVGNACTHGWNLHRVICPHGCRLDGKGK